MKDKDRGGLLQDQLVLSSTIVASRREVHSYLISVGYEYLGTLMMDDLFVRKDLNTPDR